MSQYPVLPWILADYSSSELDLNDPRVPCHPPFLFLLVTLLLHAYNSELPRPLQAYGCPLTHQSRCGHVGISGALITHQTPSVKFQERYDEWDEQDNEGVPKWHYGSHYSSAGIVTLFLLRLEPFTQHYVRLQSGRFDVPDRIFCSVAGSWHAPFSLLLFPALCLSSLTASSLSSIRRESASGNSGDLNLSDVRELIPEFLFVSPPPPPLPPCAALTSLPLIAMPQLSARVFGESE